MQKYHIGLFEDLCNDDFWGSDKVVGDGGHYSRAQRSNGQHLQNDVATGKSLISLKTNPLAQKICFTGFVHPALTFSRLFFFPLSKSKKFPKLCNFS